MAAGKEIRGKIKSVENTKKITKAMEMVAASKMRKAQDRMRSADHTATPYATSQPTWRKPIRNMFTPSSLRRMVRSAWGSSSSPQTRACAAV